MRFSLLNENKFKILKICAPFQRSFISSFWKEVDERAEMKCDWLDYQTRSPPGTAARWTDTVFYSREQEIL